MSTKRKSKPRSKRDADVVYAGDDDSSEDDWGGAVGGGRGGSRKGAKRSCKGRSGDAFPLDDEEAEMLALALSLSEEEALKAKQANGAQEEEKEGGTETKASSSRGNGEKAEEQEQDTEGGGGAIASEIQNEGSSSSSSSSSSKLHQRDASPLCGCSREEVQMMNLEADDEGGRGPERMSASHSPSQRAEGVSSRDKPPPAANEVHKKANKEEDSEVLCEKKEGSKEENKEGGEEKEPASSGKRRRMPVERFNFLDFQSAPKRRSLKKQKSETPEHDSSLTNRDRGVSHSSPHEPCAPSACSVSAGSRLLTEEGEEKEKRGFSKDGVSVDVGMEGGKDRDESEGGEDEGMDEGEEEEEGEEGDEDLQFALALSLSEVDAVNAPTGKETSTIQEGSTDCVSSSSSSSASSSSSSSSASSSSCAAPPPPKPRQSKSKEGNLLLPLPKQVEIVELSDDEPDREEKGKETEKKGLSGERDTGTRHEERGGLSALLRGSEATSLSRGEREKGTADEDASPAGSSLSFSVPQSADDQTKGASPMGGASSQKTQKKTTKQEKGKSRIPSSSSSASGGKITSFFQPKGKGQNEQKEKEKADEKTGNGGEGFLKEEEGGGAAAAGGSLEKDREEGKEQAIQIFHGASLEDRGSVFQAHAARVGNLAEVKRMRSQLLSDRKIASATHNIAAWRAARRKKKPNAEGGAEEEIEAGHDSDGERWAGAKLQGQLRELGADGVAVVVTRWFGGTLLGPARFRHILDASESVLKQNGLVSQGMFSRGGVARGVDAGKPCVCGEGVMRKRSGKYGDFYGCSRYPQCKNTQQIR